MDSSPMAGTGFDIRRLLQPASVAIAGASPDPHSIGGAIFRNLLACGFGGELTLVSRSRDEIDGRPCVRSLREIPQNTDLAVLGIPRAGIREAVEDCAAKGVGSIVAFAAGFSESGEAGRLEQEAISDICHRAGIAMLGPNCLGFTNYADRVAVSFEELSFDDGSLDMKPRRVAVIAQSGATAANIRRSLVGRGIAVSHVVATGNEAVLRIDDFIDYVLDEDVSAVALYVEQVRKPEAFLRVARKARERGVPLVMLHPGRSDHGREAALSHTGALTGDYAVMKAAVENEAVVLVETMDELLDSTAVLQRFPRPRAGAAAIITNSGAIRGLSLDMMEDTGMEAARLQAAAAGQLEARLPAGINLDLPLDVGTAGYSDASVFTDTSRILLEQDDIGSVIWAMTGGGPSQQRAKAQAMVPLMDEVERPLVLTITGDESALDPECMATVRAHEIPFFRSPDRTIRAMAALQRHAREREAAGDRSPAIAASPALSGGGVIPEATGKRWLGELGISVPAGTQVQTLPQALAAAGTLGYPLVIKAQGPQLLHKSDVGGVIVGIDNDDALCAAWQRLQDNLGTRAPGIEIEGVLVERMAPAGLEMVVGAKRDPQWGPVVVVGLGGVWIEALQAVEILPPDISHRRARERILSMRGSALLGAFRGQPARDVDALATVAVTLGQAMRADASIREIDINPVLVLAQGEGVVALDALIVKDPA